MPIKRKNLMNYKQRESVTEAWLLSQLHQHVSSGGSPISLSGAINTSPHMIKQWKDKFPTFAKEFSRLSKKKVASFYPQFTAEESIHL